MPFTVTPVAPIVLPGQDAPEAVLQAGTVIDARVLKILSNNWVRISIADISIDVLSQVPLQVGQNLQLAVSQTPDGIKLTLVAGSAAATAAAADEAAFVPNASVSLAAASVIDTVLGGDQLSPPERAAVSVAAENAATQQQSLAPLFANLGAVAGSETLPPALREAVMQLLAQRTTLDQNLSGEDIKTAFQNSGIFLEASLASESIPQGGVPDLKAALIVLRQALLSTLGADPAAPAAAAPQAASGTTAPQPAPATATPQSAPGTATSQSAPGMAAPQPGGAGAVAPQSMPSGSPVVAAGLAAYAQEVGAAPGLFLSSAPGSEMPEILLPQATLPFADDGRMIGGVRVVLSEALLNTAMQATPAAAILSMLQQKTPQAGGNAWTSVPVSKDGSNQEPVANTPPPFKGALPSAQRVASASIEPNAPLSTIAHRLLDDTDAALARQTLLQVASLPDRLDGANGRIDQTGPRWSFEIPFAMPQGTAVAQFEISRDGGGNEVEAAQRTWRARFSLDVEPAGPVHALVSLVGERTSVRMWAERPATATRLREGAGELSQALGNAELKLGDIVIGDGSPPQPRSAPAGHFLDRAL